MNDLQEYIDRLPEELKGHFWYPHGHEVNEDHLARIISNIENGERPEAGICGTRSDRRWDTASKILKKHNVIEYRKGGEGWCLTEDFEAQSAEQKERLSLDRIKWAAKDVKTRMDADVYVEYSVKDGDTDLRDYVPAMNEMPIHICRLLHEILRLRDDLPSPDGVVKVKELVKFVEELP